MMLRNKSIWVIQDSESAEENSLSVKKGLLKVLGFALF